jgi:hypothetical protein
LSLFVGGDLFSHFAGGDSLSLRPVMPRPHLHRGGGEQVLREHQLLRRENVNDQLLRRENVTDQLLRRERMLLISS